MLNGKTFIITGSTGRLGCESTARLEDMGADVFPVVLNGYPQKPKRVKLAAKTEPIIIENTGDLKHIKAPDFVINFHWLVKRTLSYADQFQYELDHSLFRIVYFWEWIKEISCQRCVNISSTKVFSPLNANPISAETDPLPLSPYGLAKLTAERFLDAFFHPSDVALVHIRLCSVASYGEHPTQILSRLFHSAYKGKAIKINSGHSMNLLYIDEAVDLIINAALQANKSKYLLASPAIAIDEMAARFEKISGKKLNAEHIDLDPGVVDPVFQSEIELLHASWIRRTAFDSMIEKIIAQYLSAPTVSDDLEAKSNFNRIDHPANHGDKVSV